VTVARLWVDATTYLPMRENLRMSNGQQNVTDYTSLGPGLAGAPGSSGLFHELAVVSFGQVVSASSIVGKMVNTGPGPVARKAGNRERT
jgi:hypothetical protein